MEPREKFEGCSVDRLLIKGIRSFSPANKTAIEFYKPLTLIVGQNGAGKTTIIECLKQATTGDLPPNVRSGQAFVHDPKVAGENEVKAQVKLRFRTVTGRPVICIRSFSLTQKASKREYKTLDSTLVSKNELNENVALSSRCADVDKEVPALMGVSKAVLDNVIFVHQDESNWPLADGATLKKKFDDIFSATRYTRALEAIRKLKTDQNQQVKEHKLKLETLQTRQDQAMRLRSDLDTDNVKANHLIEVMAADQMTLQELKQQTDELEGIVEKLQVSEEELNLLQTRRDMSDSHNQQTYAALESTIDEPIEEILKVKEQYESSMPNLQKRSKAAEAKVNRKRMDVEKVREGIVQVTREESKLRAAMENHDENLVKRRGEAHQASRAFPHVAGEMARTCTEPQVEDFIRKVVSSVDALKAQVSQHKSNQQQEQDQHTHLLMDVASKLQEIDRTIKQKNAQRDRQATKLKDLAEQLREASVSERALKGAKRKESESLSSVEAARLQREEEKFSARIEEAKSGIDAVSRDIYNLNRSRDQLTAASEEMQRLTLMKEELGKKEEEHDTLLSTKRPLLQALLPDETVPDSAPEFVALLQGTLRQLDAQLLTKQGEEKQKHSEMVTCEARHRDAAKSLQAKEKQAAALRKRLLKGTTSVLGPLPDHQVEGDEFNARINEKVEALDAKRFEYNDVNNTSKIFKSYLARARRDHNCPLCHRCWEDNEQEQSFLSTMENNMKSAPARLDSLDVEVKSAEATVNKLKDLQPIWMQYEGLKQDIAQVSASVEELEPLKTAAQDSMDNIVAVRTELEMHRRKVGALESEAQALVRLGQEVCVLKKEVAQRERRLPPMDHAGESRSIAAVNSEIEQLENKRATLEASRDDLARKKENMDMRIASLEGQYRDAREALLRAEQQAKRREELQASVNELEENNRTLVQEVQDLKDKSPALIEDQAQLKRQEQAARKVSRDKEDELAGSLRDLQRVADKLEEQTRAIRDFEKRNVSAELAKSVKKMENLQSKQTDDQEQLEKAQQELKEAEDVLQEKSSMKRIIDGNLAYLRGLEEVKQLDEKLVKLKSHQNSLGDYRAISRKLAELKQSMDQLTKHSFTQKGTFNQLEANIAKNKKELMAPQYRDIDQMYKDKLIELRTTEMANHDLDKYYQALDRTLMKFHTDKMEEINKIIKELWQQTYQGQDIDLIQIKTDMEGAAGRSYNYRVVMKCGDADLDMRGRCSAGQKVLACLIIRLALAETFCLKCGILALDEPTTNLDQKNSQALAASLVNIMQARRDQKNFQLIVITHDERFAHQIGQREHAEYYWRVTKDQEQHSLIEREDVFS
mmetsp:Transcript_39623/g.74414  ORF Transcript_39623/g.74414 Transcript_39623/m.74414 type:complete len:1331 (-) Transcript_39623:619-4611(-)